jgi:GntR family transcriptional repressor for pyruvate dehydrogenase complex
MTGPSSSTGTTVARQVLALLASSGLREGDRIPSERVLAAELHVKRSVLREALRSLMLLGLLESRPGSGTFVSGADSEWVSKAIEWGLLLGVRNTVDLVEARSQLEIIVARLAAERRTAEDIEELGEVIEAIARAGDDRSGLTSLDLAFHLGLARASHSHVLSHLLESVSTLLEVWISRVLASTPAAELHGDMYLEHKQILDAVAAADPAKAEGLMREAMRKGQRNLAQSLQAAAMHEAEERADRLLVIRGTRSPERTKGPRVAPVTQSATGHAQR